MGAARPVNKIEVDEYGLSIAAGAYWNATFHLVEIQSFVALSSSRAPHLSTWPWWHVELRFDAGGRYLSDLLNLRGEDSLGHQEDIAAEGRALMARPHLRDDSGSSDCAPARHLSCRCDHIIKLQIRLWIDGYMKYQWR